MMKERHRTDHCARQFFFWIGRGFIVVCSRPWPACCSVRLPCSTWLVFTRVMAGMLMTIEWHCSCSRRSSDSMDKVGNLWVSKMHFGSEMITCFDGMPICAGRSGYASMAPTASTSTSQSAGQSDFFPWNFPLLVWPWPWCCRGHKIDEKDAGWFTTYDALAATHIMLRWIPASRLGMSFAFFWSHVAPSLNLQRKMEPLQKNDRIH